MDYAQECQKALVSRFPEWVPHTLSSLFDSVAALHPERPAILTDGAVWTYNQAQQESVRLAAAIVGSGIPVGSRIAVIMANFPEFIFIKLAIARCGCIAVPINYQLKFEELSYVIGQAECVAAFGMAKLRDRDFLPDYEALIVRHPDLRFVAVRVSVDDVLEGKWPEGKWLEGILTLSTFAERGSPDHVSEAAVRQAAVLPHDLSDIVYTSGTTGHPKGAMLTHDMLLRSAFSSALTRAFEDGRRILFALPMYHVFGYVECWVAGLFVGGAIVPQPQFDAVGMIDLAEAHGATDIVCVPVMTHALLDAVRARGAFTAPLRAFFNSGGVNLPTVWTDISDILGVSEIHTAYGMTETTASTMCTRSGDPLSVLLETNGRYKLAGAAGDPRLGGKVALYRVVDPATGDEIAAGLSGELQVRGPVVTTGYFRKPDETEAAFTPDGWFQTGDVGIVSADGYLTLTGRIKEAYRCGGEMVMPREIEALLETYPGIAQVLVVGVPDPRMGEAGCLCIVSDPSHPLDEQVLLGFCRDKLARFKVPKHVLHINAADIPVTATGRPQKFALARLARDRLGLA